MSTTVSTTVSTAVSTTAAAPRVWHTSIGQDAKKTFETEVHPGILVKVDNESVKRMIEVVGKERILRWRLPVIAMDAEWRREDGAWVCSALGERHSDGGVAPYGFRISPAQFEYIYGVPAPVTFRLD